jgi:ABC-type Fe3+ transport system substrate-binding protein
MTYFEKTSTLLEITEKYPLTIPVFTSNGFTHMSDPEKRKLFGKSVSLEMALMLRQLDYSTFERFLIEAIEAPQNNTDATLAAAERDEQAELNVVGLLPCPVRLPLLEEFNRFIEEFKVEHKTRINYELKAASMGLDWVQNNIEGVTAEDQLPDLFISAGFEMFFDKKKIGQFKKRGVFRDLTGMDLFNPSFDGLGLEDPQGHFSLIGVVPAVFLINLKELETLSGKPSVPRSWEDLMDPVFENRISLPVGDFDLFNGILLNIHKKYGDGGVERLGRSLLESLHPSQMVKSDRMKENKPVVTIMPYFFTKMVKEGGSMEAVWPEDGAIISPIFMLSKEEKQKKLQPVIDFFAGEEVGTILSHKGLFPTTHPGVDNRLPGQSPFMWLGWDYIESHDISELISHCESVFERSVK